MSEKETDRQRMSGSRETGGFMVAVDWQTSSKKKLLKNAGGIT